MKENILKVLAIAASLFFSGYFLELSVHGNLEKSFEILTELFTIFISFSIFSITWYAYSRSRDNHALFLGAAFLAIGVLDVFHTLSYPFMPAFITPNFPHKSAIFWSLARFISASLFLTSVYIYKDSLPKLIRKSVLFGLIIAPAFILAILLSFYYSYLPAVENPDGSPSIARMLAVIISVVVILYSSYLYINRIKKTQERNFVFLIYGFIIVVFSNIIYFSYEISGHLLKIAGFYYVFIALYKSSVETPYLKLAEAEEKLLHAAEERYRNLFDNANDAIIISDLEGKVVSWNKSAKRIFGWGANEAMGRKLSELIVPENLRVETGKVVSGIETLRLCKDGSIVNVSPTVSPLLDREQNIVGLSHVIRDITEHKKVEELRLENERLILANQAKSEFLAIMSHELRTPLNAVIGFSELLKLEKAGELNEKQENYVENVLSSGRHLLSIINDILDLTKIEAGKIEMVIEMFSVPKIINDTLDLIKANAEERNIVIKKELDPQLDFIEADKKKFKQVIFNLLSNAVKFSKPEGGVVAVKAKKVNDMAQISVSDTGIGIKEEDMGKLFMVFQQLDSGFARKYGGSGLGLAISKQLVELHGGKIWAESKYGEGSTFTFLLPLKVKRRG